MQFMAIYNYMGKGDLSKGCWNPKRKVVVTVHFSKVIFKTSNHFGKYATNCL